MDTMVWTKIIGAGCGSLLVFLLIQWAAEEVYHEHHDAHKKVAYLLEVDELEIEDDAIKAANYAEFDSKNPGVRFVQDHPGVRFVQSDPIKGSLGWPKVPLADLTPEQ
jgi:hypothetical protein